MNSVTGDLCEVPGITKQNKELLNNIGINTTYQLFGKYMTFVTPIMKPSLIVWCFISWLTAIGISATDRKICAAAVGEKLNVSFPGVYDSDISDLEESAEDSPKDIVKMPMASENTVSERLTKLEYSTDNLCNTIANVTSQQELVDTRLELQETKKKLASVEKMTEQSHQQMLVLTKKIASLDIATKQLNDHKDRASGVSRTALERIGILESENRYLRTMVDQFETNFCSTLRDQTSQFASIKRIVEDVEEGSIARHADLDSRLELDAYYIERIRGALLANDINT
jgi:hypothetical protein